MANFIAVVDQDAHRRNRFADRVSQRVAIVADLIVETAQLGEFAAVWARNARSPLSRHVDQNSAAIIWGRPLPAGGATPVSADQLARSWHQTSGEQPAALDGFHAAVSYHLG